MTDSNLHTPRFGSDTALLVVDVQHDFLPSGSLAVTDGDKVIPIINEIALRFANVVLTQDWHPAGHASFASSHAGKSPFETIRLSYGEQILWPDHCVQDTHGAALAESLHVPHAQMIVRKGYHAGIDSYSAFTEADGQTTTGLAAWLKARGISKVYLAGLATDFCVAWSALDACKAGFAVTVIEDACRGIDTNGSMKKARADMAQAGVQLVNASDLR